MGGLFSSSAPSSKDPATVAARNVFAEYTRRGFAKVIDVFVGDGGEVQIIVIYPDTDIQSLGAASLQGQVLAGPKFQATTDMGSNVKQLGLTLKLRQQAGIDSSATSSLEHALKAQGVPLELRMGYKYLCVLAEKYRTLTGEAKQDFEQC